MPNAFYCPLYGSYRCKLYCSLAGRSPMVLAGLHVMETSTENGSVPEPSAARREYHMGLPSWRALVLKGIMAQARRLVLTAGSAFWSVSATPARPPNQFITFAATLAAALADDMLLMYKKNAQVWASSAAYNMYTHTNAEYICTHETLSRVY